MLTTIDPDTVALGMNSDKYMDVWREQLDRIYVIQLLAQFDKSEDHEMCNAMSCLIESHSDVGFVTDNLRLITLLVKRGLDFVYDIPTELAFFDSWARHAIIRRTLLELHTGNHGRDIDKASDMYIEQGFGMFRSSRSPIIWIGENTSVPRFIKTHTYLERMDSSYLS